MVRLRQISRKNWRRKITKTERVRLHILLRDQYIWQNKSPKMMEKYMNMGNIKLHIISSGFFFVLVMGKTGDKSFLRKGQKARNKTTVDKKKI